MRLGVHVEGPTEEQFVNELLASHLYGQGYSSITARLYGSARKRGRGTAWPAVRREIVHRLKPDKAIIATTMADYYGMPQSGSKEWPGRATAARLPFPERATAVEDALSADIESAMGSRFDRHRFIPFVMMHEFEALLFSDCRRFAIGIDRPELATLFQKVRDAFSSPEAIDDSPLTAPSKRIEELFPGYEKPLLGTLAALEIGMETMRAECPHFDSWVSRLEMRAARRTVNRLTGERAKPG